MKKINYSAFLGILFFQSLISNQLHAGVCIYSMDSHLELGLGVDPTDLTRQFLYRLIPNASALALPAGVEPSERQAAGRVGMTAQPNRAASELSLFFSRKNINLKQWLSSFLQAGVDNNSMSTLQTLSESVEEAVSHESCQLIILFRSFFRAEDLDVGLLQVADHSGLSDQECINIYGPEIVIRQKRGTVVAIQVELSGTRLNKKKAQETITTIKPAFGQILPAESVFSGAISGIGGIGEFIQSYQTVNIIHKVYGHPDESQLFNIQRDPAHLMAYLGEYSKLFGKGSAYSKSLPLWFGTLSTLSVLKRGSNVLKELDSDSLGKVGALITRTESNLKEFLVSRANWKKRNASYQGYACYKAIEEKALKHIDFLHGLIAELRQEEKAIFDCYRGVRETWDESKVAEIHAQLDKISGPDELLDLSLFSTCSIS